MRVIAMALLVLTTVSAVSSGVVVYTTTFGKGAVCEISDSSDDDPSSQPAVLQDVLAHRSMKARAVR